MTRTGDVLTRAHWAADRTEPVLDTTIGDVLRAAAGRAPDDLALVAGAPDPAARRQWSYAQLLDAAEQAARALLGRFRPGERVAVCAPNLPEWVVLEYAAALAGRDADLPALPAGFRDYAAWQRGALDGPSLAASAEWWRRELEGAPQVFELPPDRPRPPVQGFGGFKTTLTLAPALAAEARDEAEGQVGAARAAQGAARSERDALSRALAHGGGPAVRDVRLTPPRVSLGSLAIHETIPAVLGVLAAAGVPVRELATHSATLEDVFVSLTGRHLRDG